MTQTVIDVAAALFVKWLDLPLANLLNFIATKIEYGFGEQHAHF